MADSSRDRIVEAAYRTLVRNGYHDTSMKDIAEEAQVALGLAHYYFQTKEDLLVEAIRYGCAPVIREWHETAKSPRSLEAAVEVSRTGLELQKQELRRNLELFTLVFEMFGVGLHNPRIRAAVNEFVQEDRERIAAIARPVFAGLQAAPESEPDAVAAAIWACLNGITLQKLIDPAFDADRAIDALWEMITAFVRVNAGAPASRGD
ncbi:MAG TPA: TetR/AcrR family transcriptional regulator [Candidatus Limnocylindrales bacterium]|nr:TetR/AcrR family transcriptional regulator [Candidatus Limnocylindrales bacterium]